MNIKVAAFTLSEKSINTCFGVCPNPKSSAQFENEASDVCKECYYVRKSLVLLAGIGIRTLSSV